MRDTRPTSEIKVEKKPREISEADQNMAKLRNIRQDIFEKEKSCNENVDKSTAEVKKLLEQGKREQAKYVLQRKKLYEGYLDQISKNSVLIENTIVEYQKTKLDKGMAEALIGAQKIIKDINKAIDLNKVMEVVDDANDLSQKQAEMSKLLDEYQMNDLGDLDAELNEIQAQNVSKDLGKIGQVNVPKHEAPQERTQEKTQNENKKVDAQMEELLN